MKYTTKIKIKRLLAVCMLALILALFAMIPVMGSAMAEAIVPDAAPVVSEDISWLKAYMNEAIIALCVAIGLLYKHCSPWDNKYIPLLVAVVGIGAAVAIHWHDGITMLVFVEGIWSGLASTGLHQLFTRLFLKTE